MFKPKPTPPCCISCVHSRFEPCGTRKDDHLVCTVLPPNDQYGHHHLVRDHQPACPSYSEQFSLDRWRAQDVSHPWQPSSFPYPPADRLPETSDPLPETSDPLPETSDPLPEASAPLPEA